MWYDSQDLLLQFVQFDYSVKTHLSYWYFNLMEEGLVRTGMQVSLIQIQIEGLLHRHFPVALAFSLLWVPAKETHAPSVVMTGSFACANESLVPLYFRPHQQFMASLS